MRINFPMLLLFLLMINIFVHTKVPKSEISMNQTFAHIKDLSFQLPDHQRADRAMHQLLCSNIKLTRRVLTKNLIKMIMKKDIGTNEVETFVKNVCKQNVNSRRNVGLIKSAMNVKLKDAEYDAQHLTFSTTRKNKLS